jgi:hypothetical protein
LLDASDTEIEVLEKVFHLGNQHSRQFAPIRARRLNRRIVALWGYIASAIPADAYNSAVSTK